MGENIKKYTNFHFDQLNFKAYTFSNIRCSPLRWLYPVVAGLVIMACVIISVHLLGKLLVVSSSHVCSSPEVSWPVAQDVQLLPGTGGRGGGLPGG